MNLWFRIWKTVELTRETAGVIFREIFRYYFNPYIIIRILQLVSALSRRIRQVWLTRREVESHTLKNQEPLGPVQE